MLTRLVYIRMMEKENKKAREDARRDYNDVVRVSQDSFPPFRRRYF